MNVERQKSTVRVSVRYVYTRWDENAGAHVFEYDTAKEVIKSIGFGGEGFVAILVSPSGEAVEVQPSPPPPTPGRPCFPAPGLPPARRLLRSRLLKAWGQP